MCFSFVRKVSDPGQRKTLKLAEYPEMEKKLYAWYIEQQDKYIPMSFDILTAKAKQIFKQCYNKDRFVASRGWLLNFKERHGLRRSKTCETIAFNDELSATSFMEKLTHVINENGILPPQIYNAKISNLFWKMLPQQRIDLSKSNTASSKKINKERITFLACTNGDGSHKLKLSIIGKSKNITSFNDEDVPVEYIYDNNARMTSFIFKDWFHNSFCKQVQGFMTSKNLPEKALLLIKNAEHLGCEELISENGRVRVIYIVPNCTTLIQPIDQNTIKQIKLFYRKNLQNYFLAITNQDGKIKKHLKTLNLKNSVCLLHNAWQKVETNAFQLTECYSNMTDYEPEYLCLKTETLESASSISEEQQSIKKEILQWEEESDEEHYLQDVVNENPLSHTEDRKQHPNQEIKHQTAIKCFSVGIEWAEKNSISENKIQLLKEIREEAMKLHMGIKN